ncbi:Peroxiredoxin [Bernardetia litoralis DSM 6794]|uniref:Peroxiredoxin n=1 Tax=Bernardetia litoralis (strain ATCC 23117 / DSM 6794 / NBRC 15988 / NCIMB 1366 / Fx l1 / Sio-4) TaxID=880071 RepID=I4AQ30_BERLS|nr:redoxin domain-containing protein [Bernardetia litoralis]AFM06065.1 Peroxiredoxin [Bernardetia litoralis DSM 6794]
MNKLFILLILSTFLFSCAEKTPFDKGEPAPKFETTDVEGNKQTIEQHTQKGKIVMLYFWADWCPTCKQEFPETQTYYEKLQKEGLEILAINVKQPKEASTKFKEQFGATFPMLIDEDGKISDLYKVEELPTNFFIDEEGKIIRKIVGWVSDKQAEVILKQQK